MAFWAKAASSGSPEYSSYTVFVFLSAASGANACTIMALNGGAPPVVLLSSSRCA